MAGADPDGPLPEWLREEPITPTGALDLLSEEARHGGVSRNLSARARAFFDARAGQRERQWPP